MWDLPGPGLEPVSPALAGGFLTTAPPGKSYCSVINSSWKEIRRVIAWVGDGGALTGERHEDTF